MVADEFSSRCVSSLVVTGLSRALNGVRYAVTVTEVTGDAIGAAAPVAGALAFCPSAEAPFPVPLFADCPKRLPAASSTAAANSPPNLALKGNHRIRMSVATGDKSLK